MAADILLPTTPARVRVLILPVGRLKKSIFGQFVDTLRSHSTIRLGDVTPDPRPNRTMFSPLAFPDGMLLYDMSTSLPTPSQLALSPFEQFREPLIVIGVAESTEYAWDVEASEGSRSPGHGLLATATNRLRDTHDRALVHRVFLLNAEAKARHLQLPSDVVPVPPQTLWKTTTIKTIMCDLSSVFLAELTTFAKSIQALPTIPSPASPETSSAADFRQTRVMTSEMERRGSATAVNSRPQSPETSAAANPYRMSMPAHLPSSNLPPSSHDEKPISPPSSSHGAPPTTFDEISGASNTSISRSNSVAQRSSAGGLNRTPSQDRVSVHGFGPGGVLERARNKGISRVGIAMGSLYLLAGLWADALRELTEHATSARNLSDHLWHAKALENILVCLVLLSWKGIDYQIPQICYPIIDKTVAATKSPQHTPSSSVTDVNPTTSPRSSAQLANLQKLSALLPDFVNMILAVYSRAANFSGESLPPKGHCECIVRLCRLLAAAHLSGGYLSDAALQHAVLGSVLSTKHDLSLSRVSINPTKNEIASILFRALPSAPEVSGMSVVDASLIFTGIASVLSTLRLHRKRAIVLKQLISILIPAIVQARKLGAAEMGVHPAAGLGPSASSDDDVAGSNTGLIDFLGTLGDVYGITRLEPYQSNGVASGTRTGMEDQIHEKEQSSSEPRLLQSFETKSILQGFGSLRLKLDILRMCISFCEALPDFAGLLHFTSALLRTAGPSGAPRSDSSGVLVELAKDEQIRHANTILRSVSTARKLGLSDIEAEYWDDFLVRGVSFADAPAHKYLTKHKKADLDAVNAAQKKSSPFLHDPFASKNEDQSRDLLLVANDEYEFLVTLQNPYEIEIELERLSLESEGVAFEATLREQVLGPYRTQRYSIVGVASKPGRLTIHSCTIKIRGCRGRSFPIFSEPWSPNAPPKIKGIGLDASKPSRARPVSNISTSSDSQDAPKDSAPIPMTLKLHVLPPQPTLAVSNLTIAQSSIMLLEGERSTFTIKVHNTSSTTAVDFLHISFQDSVTTALRNAIANKDLPHAEIHELELQLAQYPPLRLLSSTSSSSNSSESRIHGNEEHLQRIDPGATATFTISILGRPGLIEGAIQIDYGNIKQEVVPDHFFTRQVSAPVRFTVNASVQLQRFDIVPFDRSVDWPANSSSQTDPDKGGASPSVTEPPESAEERCLLLIDLRNAWPSPLTITLSTHSTSTRTLSHSTTTLLHPGHTTRLLLPLPLISIPNPHLPIPSLNPATARQFIVSSAQHSPALERATREAFWYRDALLHLISGQWVEESTQRTGAIDLRAIRLSPKMVAALQNPTVKITMQILSAASPDQPEASTTGSPSHHPEIISRTANAGRKFALRPLHPTTLLTTITNTTPLPISAVLRLLPTLSSLSSPHTPLPHSTALDLSKKLIISGLPQRVLPPIAPGQSTEYTVGITALATGTYEIAAVVEELQIPKTAEEENEKGGKGIGAGKGRGRSGTAGSSANVDYLGDRLLGERERRVWTSRENCVLVVRGDDAAVEDGDED